MRKLLTLLAVFALTGCADYVRDYYYGYVRGQNVREIPAERPHESWCYETIGQPDCYASPQSLPPGRLIAVDPADKRPLTPSEYREDLRSPTAAPVTPVDKEPIKPAAK